MSHVKSRPKIIANGYMTYGGKPLADEPPHPEQVEACRIFLARCERTKTGRYGSYGLKHVVENAMNRYVSNGALLQACRDLGIPAPQKYHDSLNGVVAVSRRSVRAACKHFKPAGRYRARGAQ